MKSHPSQDLTKSGKPASQPGFRTITPFSLLLIVLFSTAGAQDYTRGVGVYPGNPSEDGSPIVRIDTTNYRNLALHRAVYQSSSYDYNLTAQLVTDGIKESQLPGWIVTTTGAGEILPRNEREWILDRAIMTGKKMDGPSASIEIEMAGNFTVPTADSINVTGSLFVDSLPPQHWNMIISGSDDGTHWEVLGTIGGDGFPGDTLTGFWRRFAPQNLRVFSYPVKPGRQTHYRFYRLEVQSPNVLSWDIGEFAFFKNGRHCDIGGPYNFTSAWMSAGSKEEWLYVDLGAICTFDRIVLTWIRRAGAGSIQVSDDASHWTSIMTLSATSAPIDDIKLPKPEKGRYVRVLMTEPSSMERYVLSELEVFGRGGPVVYGYPQPPVGDDGRMELAGGAWRLQRESLVDADGERLSRPGFNDKDWIAATVPATVLVSYCNAGALPDPNFGDNQLAISDSYFYSDFWYRNEFVAPAQYSGKRIFLNFDGINWKAEIYFNGKKLGLIEGAFIRGKFDVTDILIPGGKNVLAVLIKKNDAPGYVKEQTKLNHDSNGGELGADNPTFHASVGWDWMPTIRGRNTGIWNNVYLSSSGPVTIEDPLVSSDLPLPEVSPVEVQIDLSLCNHTSKQVSGKLRGKFGSVTFERPVTLDAFETKTIRFNPSTDSSLRIRNPRLWWPNGYGEQNLYIVRLEFVTGSDEISDRKSFETGIRKMSYSEDGGVLKIWVNGKRFIAKGGNWGFSESMLRYRGREYDAAVRYHKEMNFTMIRNWVGQTADDEFFEACDRYGIMIWQDFWLANPLDGPDPDDNAMFMRNAEDFVKRIRNHPSLALYCGRNEGNPPQAIDLAIRKLLPQLHPGVHYISNSAFGVVSGGGPYRAMPVKFYFEKRATEKLHSEMGMPNMVTYESLKRMIPDSTLWPINRMWGIHDFNLESAQYGLSFIQQIEDTFGPVHDLKEWLSLAQWINYQGYRAMFEAQSKHRMGVLLWMSHPAWPSMVWQTYDYYLEPTAAYFGCKKACEPLHIQWNPLSDSIEVVNASNANGAGLTASMEIINMDGTIKSDKSIGVDCPEDQTVRCFRMEYPDGVSSVYFIRLRLKKGDVAISDNFYWRGLKEGDLRAVREIPKVKLETFTKHVIVGKRNFLVETITNGTKWPALMVTLKVVNEKTKERVLPVIISDNYITLMPGEERTISMEVEVADLRGAEPGVVVEGINIE